MHPFLFAIFCNLQRILEAMNIEINNLNDLRTVNIDQSDQIEDFLTVIDPVKDNNILNSESNFGLNEIKKQEIQMMENEINAMDERDQKATNNIEFIEEQIKVGKERNVNLKKKCEHLDRMQCVLTSCRLYPPIVDERKVWKILFYDMNASFLKYSWKFLFYSRFTVSTNCSNQSIKNMKKYFQVFLLQMK